MSRRGDGADAHTVRSLRVLVGTSSILARKRVPDLPIPVQALEAQSRQIDQVAFDTLRAAA